MLLVMCGIKLSKKHSHQNRPDINESIKDPNLDDSDVVRLLRAGMTWKEWMKNDFLRYWFIVGSFALNIFVVFEPARIYHVTDILGYFIMIATFLSLCVGEYYLYRHFWPKGILSER